MKRIFYFLLIFLLTFSACAKNNKAPAVCGDFDAVIKISMQNEGFENQDLRAELLVEDKENIANTVINPDEISGLEFVWTKDSFEMVFRDLHCVSEKDYLPGFSFARLIYSSLASLYSGSARAEKSETGWIYYGECSGGEFSAFADESGYLKSINAESVGFFAEFIYE